MTPIHPPATASETRARVLRLPLLSLAGCTLLGAALSAHATEPDAATKRWWNHVLGLSNDSLVGRDTGSPEHRRALEYVIRILQANGVKPAGEQGYLQSVPLKSVSMVMDRSKATLARDGKEEALGLLTDIAGPVSLGLPPTLSGPLVFAGSDNAASLNVAGAILVRLNPPRLVPGPTPAPPPSPACPPA